MSPIGALAVGAICAVLGIGIGIELGLGGDVLALSGPLDWLDHHGAAFIAGCAFIVALYSAYATRRHHILSVRPHLDLTWERLYSSREEGNDPMYRILLRNNGLGPAIIKSYQVTLDGDPVETRHGDIVLAKVASVVAAPLHHITNYHLSYEASIVEKDEPIVLLSIVFRRPISGADYNAAVERFEARTNARIEYMSIYRDETFTLESDRGY